MSIFGEPLSQLTTNDLVELLESRAVENVRLEFKREAPSKLETLKKLSSFANTFGGYLVVGAEASSSDGRIAGLPGVELQSGYKQRITQWCFDGASPPLTVEVSEPIEISRETSRVCYVMYVAESVVAPHFLNGREGVYVRADEFSAPFQARLANDSELRHLLDRRKLVLERRDALLTRASARFGAFTERKYRELNDRGRELIGATFELSVIPQFPSLEICNHQRVRMLLRQKTVPWRQVGFPRNTFDLVSQHESVIALRPGSSFSLMEVNTWGLLFYATEIDRERNGVSGIPLMHFAGQLLVFLHHAALLLPELGHFGSLLIGMRLRGILGVPWIYPAGGYDEIGRASELDDEASFSMQASSELLVQKPDRIVLDLLQYVLFATNWPDMAERTDSLKQVVKLGYEYNNWGRDADLRA